MLKYIAPLVSALALTSPILAQDDPKQISGTAYLQNGQSITGTILNWDDKSIQLSSPVLVDSVIFDIEEVIHIDLDTQDTNALQAPKNNRIDQTSIQINSNKYTRPGKHGVIKGSLAGISDTHITLNTWYGGQIAVSKEFIHNMDISSKGQTLFKGPGKLKDWHNNLHTNHWKEDAGGFTTKQGGNISRELELPSALHMSFDLEWRDGLNLSIFLYGDKAKTSYPQTRYELRTQLYQPIRINKYLAGRYQGFNQQHQDHNDPGVREISRIFSQKEGKARYDIYLNPKRGTHLVFINGIKFLEVTEPQPDPKQLGKAVHLMSRKGANIRISDMEIKKWTGSLPNKDDINALKELEGEGQRILLKNGDILIGEIQSIKDGLMTIKTEDATFPIPVVNMRKIDMGESKVKREPMQEAADIKAWFHDGGWVILKPISLNNGKLKAFHQAWGDCDFDINVFKKIEFNLDNKKYNRTRNQDKW